MGFFKPIDGYDGLYLISDCGEVYSNIRHKILSPKVSNTGYCRITLCGRDGVHKTYPIHRLVASAFIPNPLGKPTVNHKNEIKSDNRVENLEWATMAEQNAYGTRTARAMEHTDWDARTEKIDYSEVARKHDYASHHMCGRKYTAVYKDDVLVGVFETQKSAAEFIGASVSHVSSHINGWYKTCKGYVLKNADNDPFCIAVTKKHFPESGDADE